MTQLSILWHCVVCHCVSLCWLLGLVVCTPFLNRATENSVRNKRDSMPANICGVKMEGVGGEVALPAWLDSEKSLTTCQWYIEAPEGTRLLFEAHSFNVPNQLQLSGVCRLSYLKFLDKSSELPIPISTQCGNNFDPVYIDSNRALVKFMYNSYSGSPSSWTDVGPMTDFIPEFKISWSAYTMVSEDECAGYYCPSSGMCIDHSLVCNGLPNCGYNDKSDEMCPIRGFWADNWNIITGVSVVLIVFIICTISYFCRQLTLRRSRMQRTQNTLVNKSTQHQERHSNDPLPPIPMNNYHLQDHRCAIPPPPYSSSGKKQRVMATFGPPPAYPGSSGEQCEMRRERSAVSGGGTRDRATSSLASSSPRSARSHGGRSSNSGRMGRGNGLLWSDSGNESDSTSVLSDLMTNGKGLPSVPSVSLQHRSHHRHIEQQKHASKLYRALLQQEQDHGVVLPASEDAHLREMPLFLESERNGHVNKKQLANLVPSNRHHCKHSHGKCRKKAAASCSEEENRVRYVNEGTRNHSRSYDFLEAPVIKQPADNIHVDSNAHQVPSFDPQALATFHRRQKAHQRRLLRAQQHAGYQSESDSNHRLCAAGSRVSSRGYKSETDDAMSTTSSRASSGHKLHLLRQQMRSNSVETII